MRALSKETKNKDSGAPSYFVVDEYHAHLTSEIYDIGKSGFGKRPQALLDCITTAGDDAQRKPCYTEELNLKAMLRGEISMDETYCVMIREIDDGDNPTTRAAGQRPIHACAMAASTPGTCWTRSAANTPRPTASTIPIRSATSSRAGWTDGRPAR